jgi:hypothetical protein
VSRSAAWLLITTVALSSWILTSAAGTVAFAIFEERWPETFQGAARVGIVAAAVVAVLAAPLVSKWFAQSSSSERAVANLERYLLPTLNAKAATGIADG